MIGKNKDYNIENRNRQIDKNWEEIFNELNILEKIESNGRYCITSKTLNMFPYKKGRRIDARNMVKFDYLSSLPWIFMSNRLSILPTRRGEYIIGSYKAYEKVDNSLKTFTHKLKELEFPNWIESIDYLNITSEAIMLNSAVLAGMFNIMFPTDNFGQTLSNRMGSESFDFYVTNNKTNQQDKISVIGSQIEIDGGYETDNELLLVEAKNSTTESFLIRQLYYPYRLMSNKVTNKNIYSIYLQYLDGIYNFSVYKFTDKNNYNSLKLIQRHNFIISEQTITIDDIIKTVRSTETKPEPVHTFPQANSLSRVVGMLNSIYESEEGAITKEELTLLNDFTYRQAQYYTDACMYLGLLKIGGKDINKKDLYVLSDYSEKMMRMSSRNKKLELVRAIFSHKAFRIVFEERLKLSRSLTGGQVYNILKEEDTYMSGFSESTRKRRASTVAKWISYVFNMVNDY